MLPEDYTSARRIFLEDLAARSLFPFDLGKDLHEPREGLGADQ